VLKASLRGLGATRVGWTAACLAAGPRGVLVLMYHRVGGDEVFPGVEVARFRRQMVWLKRNCTLIAPEDLGASLAGGARLKPSVLLTFDDGYRDYHDRAFPILRELQIPAVVFLSTAFTDGGGALWTDALRWAIFRTANGSVRLPWAPHETQPLIAAESRGAALAVALRHLKQQPEPERKALLGALYRELGVGEEGPDLGRPMMNWAEVKAILPLTRVGGHTHTHPILARISPHLQEEEIRTCRDRIERMCGVRARLFAYPNGQPGDFTEETQRLLKRHGFDFAFSASEGVNGQRADPLALKRFSGRADVPQLAWLRGPRHEPA
jgi:peptidoglycan/xylan/chitin deacetylase (PgdA/CDA1 family)